MPTCLHTIGTRLVACLLLLALGSAGLAQTTPAQLPRSTPEAQGLSSAALSSFIEQADREIDTMNSFLLVRHGHVVAEGYWAPYDSATRHALYSLTKSFTSTAVGLAVAEGRMTIDDPAALSRGRADRPGGQSEGAAGS